jgi:putative alpha-1,2-mannosidase
MKVSTAFVVASLLGSVASAPRIRSGFITRRAQSVDVTNPANAVDVFVGTTKGGHVFPGPTIPHGFVKVGMDTDSPGAV